MRIFLYVNNVKCEVALTNGMIFYLSEKDCDSCLKLSNCILIAECQLFTPGLFKTIAGIVSAHTRPVQPVPLPATECYGTGRMRSQMRKLLKLSLANPRSDVQVILKTCEQFLETYY